MGRWCCSDSYNLVTIQHQHWLVSLAPETPVIHFCSEAATTAWRLLLRILTPRRAHPLRARIFDQALIAAWCLPNSRSLNRREVTDPAVTWCSFFSRNTLIFCFFVDRLSLRTLTSSRVDFWQWNFLGATIFDLKLYFPAFFSLKIFDNINLRMLFSHVYFSVNFSSKYSSTLFAPSMLSKSCFLNIEH